MAMAGALIDLAPLKATPAFRRLWIGRTFSGFGGQMTIVAVMFQVWQLTRSPIWTGAVGIAQAVPMVVVGLIGGGLADRIDRRRLVLRTTVGQFSVSILLALQGFDGHLPVLGVLALVSLQTCFVAVGGPAGRTFTPRLLPKQQVSAGLALTRISSQAAMLVGPAVAGLLLGWVGVGGCYLIDAISFGASFYGVFGLAPMRPEGEVGRPGIHGIADGLRFVASKATVRGALITDLAATVLSMPISLFPLINAERFGNNPRTLGLFLSAIAVGGMLASVLSGLFTRYHRPGLVMLGGALAWGVGLAAFGWSPNPWVGLGCLVIAGAADTLSVISRGTVIQLETPDALRGRVGAVEQMVGVSGPDLGNMRGGIVAGATSGVTALVSGGLLCVAAVAAVGAAVPGLRSFHVDRT
ncbi:MAG: MFS transporter [Actinomycetota bacterium]|nr:MFS transporter [Actinomycetota bacterium]